MDLSRPSETKGLNAENKVGPKDTSALEVRALVKFQSVQKAGLQPLCAVCADPRRMLCETTSIYNHRQLPHDRGLLRLISTSQGAGQLRLMLHHMTIKLDTVVVSLESTPLDSVERDG